MVQSYKRQNPLFSRFLFCERRMLQCCNECSVENVVWKGYSVTLVNWTWDIYFDFWRPYYLTALRRVEITPKTSTNITRYLHSRRPVRQVISIKVTQMSFFLSKRIFFLTFFLKEILKWKTWMMCNMDDRKTIFSRCEKRQWWLGENHKNVLALFSCYWPIS